MKKVLSIIGDILVWIVVAVAIFMMLFTIISSFSLNRNDRDVLGYKAYIVMSDSMSATDFSAGDIVIIKEIDPRTLDAGDIITFVSTNTESSGQTVTHKIRAKASTPNGDPGFITYGTTTGVDDEAVVSYSHVLGKYCFRIPKMGTFFNYLKSTPGYIVCILIPFVILLIVQGANAVSLFKQYKKEQQAVIDEEKAKLEAERAESQQLMQELLALKQQLAQMSSDNSSQSDQTTEE